jgi:vacuolar-type H+-ATPase subunit H
MDSKEALDKITQAEQQAEELLSSARAEAGRIIDRVHQQGAALLKEAQEKARAEAGKLKARIDQDAAGEIEALKTASLREVEALKNKAAACVEKAADFLKEKIRV